MEGRLLRLERKCSNAILHRARGDELRHKALVGSVLSRLESVEGVDFLSVQLFRVPALLARWLDATRRCMLQLLPPAGARGE